VDDLITRQDMGHGLARRLAEGAFAQAAELGIPIAVAVVDAGGNLVAVDRMDGAQTVAAPLAIDKAWTAAACAAPTDAWAQSTAPGGDDWGMSTALGGRIVVMPGGLPVMAGGQVVGGIGVSGGEGHEDRKCADAALAAVEAAAA
jgi:cob(I)alamin adenosyltransferase